jgi:hypothetical protein
VAADLDRRLWELSVAISALRQAITGLPQAILANQQQQLNQRQPGSSSRQREPRLPERKQTEKSAGDSLAPLVRQFAAVAGPLAVFAAILQSGTSGFKLLMVAVQVLAASLAPILLPVIFMIAVAFAALGDMVWKKLLPNLEQWMTFVISNLIPAVEGLVRGFTAAIYMLGRFAEGLRTAGEKLGSWTARKLGFKDPDKMPGVAPKMIEGARPEDPSKRNTLPRGTDKSQLGGMAGFTQEQLNEIAKQSGSVGEGAPAAPRGLAASLAAAARPQGTAAAGAAAAEKPTDVGEVMRDMVTELRNQLSPQAQFSQLTQIGRQIQMASFQSPFEAKMLERTTQTVDLLGKVVNNTAPRKEATH